MNTQSHHNAEDAPENFQKRISRLQRAVRVAREILDVSENASQSELKEAWRNACKQYHPDAREADSDVERADRMFNLSFRAYRCLSEGEDCEKLLEIAENKTLPDDEGFPANRWAYFLSWRDKFF